MRVDSRYSWTNSGGHFIVNAVTRDTPIFGGEFTGSTVIEDNHIITGFS
jgi:hypothetical protein